MSTQELKKKQAAIAAEEAAARHELFEETLENFNRKRFAHLHARMIARAHPSAQPNVGSGAVYVSQCRGQSPIYKPMQGA